jgi:Tol biopolymer transport system component
MNGSPPISFNDIDSTSTFKPSGVWSMSNDGSRIAVVVGRPMAQSKVGTNAYGAQPELFDIYSAHLSSELPQLKRIIASEAESFNPVWSPDGKFLAFCRIDCKQPDTIPEQSVDVAVWNLQTGVVQTVACISKPQLGSVSDAFVWSSNTTLLIFDLLESISIRPEQNPYKTSLRHWVMHG